MQNGVTCYKLQKEHSGDIIPKVCSFLLKIGHF